MITKGRENCEIRQDRWERREEGREEQGNEIDRAMESGSDGVPHTTVPDVLVFSRRFGGFRTDATSAAIGKGARRIQ